ncbi:MAG: family metalloprotease domain protein [Bacteroidetes bacterium]|nr:family metalloprotease domain protein [Bacteroidota bacterium]
MLVIFPALNAFAIRAYPGAIKITQPDGSSLNIRNHGDEFHHYTTTEDNYIVKKIASGYYTYASIDTRGKIVAGTQIARDPSVRPATDNKYLVRMPEKLETKLQVGLRKVKSVRQNAAVMKRAFPVTGSGKSLIILVNFKDNSFVVPSSQTAFTNLLNQSGYSENNGTGSAKDYFMACSYGKFAPQFDVVGPFNLPSNMSVYGGNDSDGNDKDPLQMIVDACKVADENGVDFSQYDTDNDGYVDNVFVYYAGYNEAEYGGDDTVWPHRWGIYPTVTYGIDGNYSGTVASITFDEKKIMDYACTSELKGASDSKMCGIGTFCHEFGHVLGLPDYYDTSSNQDNTLNTWSVMDQGAYLNQGNTPPVYSSYDRFYLGYSTPIELNQPANVVTLLPLYQGTTIPANTDNQAYLLSSNTHDLNGADPKPAEFFMVEYRKHTGWDTYLGQLIDANGNFTTIPSDGMLIWHIDYDKTAWENNGPNNYTESTQTQASHMRVYLQPLSGSTTTPGDAFTSGSFTPTTWDGNSINRNITEIAKTAENVTFKLMGGLQPKIKLGVISSQLTYPLTVAGKTNPKNLNIVTTGINGNLTVTLSGTNADYFTVNAASIPQANANSTSGFDLLVTYKPLTAGTHTAVLTITGGGLPDKIINLTGSAQ